MGNNDFNRIFDEEVKKRQESSEWSRRLASDVLSTLKEERKKRMFDVVSYAFPLAAAAVLFIVLAFGLSPTGDKVEQYITTRLSKSEIVKETSEYTYDEIDFYIDQCYSQR